MRGVRGGYEGGTRGFIVLWVVGLVYEVLQYYEIVRFFWLYIYIYIYN